MNEEKISVDWQALWKGILANVTFMLALFFLYQWLLSFFAPPVAVGFVSVVYFGVNGRSILPSVNDARFRRIFIAFVGGGIFFGICMAILMHLVTSFI